MYSRFVRLLVMFWLGLMVFPAWGCMSDDDLPTIWRKHMTLPVTRLAEVQQGGGVSLSHFDLLTLVVPRKRADGWRIETEPAGQETLIAFSEARFTEVLENKRFKTRLGTLTDALTESNTSVRLRFGANTPGKLRLRLVNEKLKPVRSHVLDITVEPIPLPQPKPRGSLQRIEAGGADSSVALGFYDTLEIVLPGDAATEWNFSSAEAAGLRFVSQRAAEEPGKVILTFKAASASRSDEAKMWLAPKHPRTGQAAVYHFRILHRPVPKC